MIGNDDDDDGKWWQSVIQNMMMMMNANTTVAMAKKMFQTIFLCSIKKIIFTRLDHTGADQAFAVAYLHIFRIYHYIILIQEDNNNSAIKDRFSFYFLCPSYLIYSFKQAVA